MSDEEKKEYEELKSLLYTGTISQYGKRKLIDIFEKQSKEIEELKVKNKVLEAISLSFNEIQDRDKKWKDKIKAKIEPVLKQLERKMEEEYKRYGNSREYQDIVDAYNFLQSLFEEKE